MWNSSLTTGGRTDHARAFAQYLGPTHRIQITDKGTLGPSGRILQLCWQPGQTVGMDEAHRAVSAIDDLDQGQSLPMLIHVGGVAFTRAARKGVPTRSSVSRIARLGASPVDYAIALFLLHTSPLPALLTAGIRRLKNRATGKA